MLRWRSGNGWASTISDRNVSDAGSSCSTLLSPPSSTFSTNDTATRAPPGQRGIGWDRGRSRRGRAGSRRVCGASPQRPDRRRSRQAPAVEVDERVGEQPGRPATRCSGSVRSSGDVAHPADAGHEDHADRDCRADDLGVVAGAAPHARATGGPTRSAGGRDHRGRRRRRGRRPGHDELPQRLAGRPPPRRAATRATACSTRSRASPSSVARSSVAQLRARAQPRPG